MFAFRGKMKIFSLGKILVPAYVSESADSATASLESEATNGAAGR